MIKALLGVGILSTLISIAIIIFIIVIVILTFLAINNLHRLPKIQDSIENIEKHLRFLAKYERERLIKEGYITQDADSNASPINHYANSGDTWICKKCGDRNLSLSSYCKGCGTYK